jgi:hypothetical protein
LSRIGNECKPLPSALQKPPRAENVLHVRQVLMAEHQGLTLVHFPAQLEPFLTQSIPYTPPSTLSHPLTLTKHPLNNP